MKIEDYRLLEELSRTCVRLPEGVRVQIVPAASEQISHALREWWKLPEDAAEKLREGVTVVDVNKEGLLAGVMEIPRFGTPLPSGFFVQV